MPRPQRPTPGQNIQHLSDLTLDKQTKDENTEWFFRRYIRHLPRGGEIVLFDRSWYNRAGVERVMGFCDAKEYLEFMRQALELDRMLVSGYRSGIRPLSGDRYMPWHLIQTID